ncbi:MAG: M56 family metallopeptidase [Proteobacteria bacterium]|nr:M56 family metallopeptidase [Pseudomonadota bacterium]
MSALVLPVLVIALVLSASWLAAALIYPMWTAIGWDRPRWSRAAPLIAALPWIVGLAVLVAAVLPGDPHHGPQLLACHCSTSQPGWVHLCPHHPEQAIGMLPLALLVIALLLPGRLRAWQRLISEPLGTGTGAVPTLLSLPSPGAVLVGWWRPSLVIDAGLWSALSSDDRHALVAHERAHLARRDPLVLMAMRLLVSLGPKASGHALTRLWLDDAERSADARAADEVGATNLASALVRCARLGLAPAHALGWTGGQLERRVTALLDESPRAGTPAVGAADFLVIGGAVLLALASTPWLHHQLEHLLNASL